MLELHVCSWLAVLSRPNQAMQLAASKPPVYAWSVCRMLRSMQRGLEPADLVSR